jgi:hypothetical protein
VLHQAHVERRDLDHVREAEARLGEHRLHGLEGRRELRLDVGDAAAVRADPDLTGAEQQVAAARAAGAKWKRSYMTCIEAGITRSVFSWSSPWRPRVHT